MKEISIVIPLYNEEKSLAALADKLENVLKNLGQSYEIIFIDDGSTDNSFSILETLCETKDNIKVYQLRTNFGKSYALNVGFKVADGDIVITMDADLQDDPHEIPNMLAKIREGYDIVSGWKKDRKDPLFKVLSSKVFNYVTRKFSGVNLHDFNCGLKAYRKEAVQNIDIYGEIHRFIPVLADWKGFKITEIQVRHHARQFGRSKYGSERFLSGLFDFATICFITRYMFHPMHFFGKLGITLFAIGFAIDFYLTIQWIIYYVILDYPTVLTGRPLLLFGVLLLILGSLFLATGLISEMFLFLNITSSKRNEEFMIKKTISSGRKH